ncbi:MAG: phosphoserine phosphatase [Candidatus Tokpelaia sp. JSC188]|nr:MAG: phosphoserine phosphatase [Candidatus Tokpelaia sp. JSC188]
MLSSQPFIATLIVNPENPILTSILADKAACAINAISICWLEYHIACDIRLPDGAQVNTTYKILQDVIASAPVDIIVQPMANRRKKLLLADMDSTMIEQECVDELAKEADLDEHVANITQRAMNGEIAFESALRERVLLFKNLPLSIVDNVLKKRITLMPGGRELVRTMRANGAYTALVSGGFTLFAEKIAFAIGFNEYNANILEHDGIRLNGFVREPILGKEAKLEKLLKLCAKLNISPSETIAVGDGANDLSMLQHAGSGIALHAKPIVAKIASFNIYYSDLTALLYIQGYRKTDFVT